MEVIPKTKFCKYCRHENPIELSQCEECGKPLAEFFVSVVPRPKRMPPPGFISNEEYCASTEQFPA